MVCNVGFDLGNGVFNCVFGLFVFKDVLVFWWLGFVICFEMYYLGDVVGLYCNFLNFNNYVLKYFFGFD